MSVYKSSSITDKSKYLMTNPIMVLELILEHIHLNMSFTFYKTHKHTLSDRQTNTLNDFSLLDLYWDT